MNNIIFFFCCFLGSAITAFVFSYFLFKRENHFIYLSLNKIYEKCNSRSSKIWYSCDEHLPEPFRIVYSWSDKYLVYQLVYWDPKCGWKNEESLLMPDISHWCDDLLFLPFYSPRQQGTKSYSCSEEDE